MQSDVLLFMMLLSGAFSKADFPFCWILINIIELNQLMLCFVIKGGKKTLKQYNLHNNVMQDQVESNSGLKKIFGHIQEYQEMHQQGK